MNESATFLKKNVNKNPKCVVYMDVYIYHNGWKMIGILIYVGNVKYFWNANWNFKKIYSIHQWISINYFINYWAP